jgi:3-carboxy-cis,cis-muconate cycloisomerase
MTTTLDCGLLGNLFGTEETRAHFDTTALIQAWLDAEAALAEAEAMVGEIPRSAAERIKKEAQAELYDVASLSRGVADSAHPLVPLIRNLAERCDTEGGWVHWGATTQDIMDTGQVLQLRRALPAIERDVDLAIAHALDLADRYRDAVMAGRTHAQHAVPITFGLKVATWADELLRGRMRLHAARTGLVGQLSGAAGTLATLPERGAEIRRQYCRLLGLEEPEPTVSWHTSRDRIRDLIYALDQIAVVSERIAGEVIRLQANEIAEVFEPAKPGHVGSSTMPQKRNPHLCEFLVGGARLLHGTAATMSFSTVAAFERDMGSWSVEWIAVPQAMILTSGVAEKLAYLLGGLEVDTKRMAENLTLTEGRIMAEAAMMELGRTLGRERAHALLHHAAQESASTGADFKHSLMTAEGLSPEQLERLQILVDSPEQYLGSQGESIQSVIDRGRAVLTGDLG